MNSKGVKMPSIRERRRPLDRFLEVIVEEDLDYFDVVPAIQANQNITALSFIIILFVFLCASYSLSLIMALFNMCIFRFEHAFSGWR
jgi:hypothetical protein